jgi:hypothetical protein
MGFPGGSRRICRRIHYDRGGRGAGDLEGDPAEDRKIMSEDTVGFMIGLGLAIAAVMALWEWMIGKIGLM